MGEVIADSVLNWFRQEENLQEISRLQESGLQFSLNQENVRMSDTLEGKTIVISGNFSISRDEMKAFIEAHGGKTSASVSGKTSYLLTGTKPGPEKVKKATELGVEIIDETQLREMTGEMPATAEEMEPTLF